MSASHDDDRGRPDATGGLLGPAATGAGGPDDDGAADDPRLLAAVREYVAAVEAGRRPNRQEILARHPDIAAELSECLQGLAFLDSAAPQFAGIAASQGGDGDPEQLRFDARLMLAKPLGDFKLVREIGRGGMGIVYEAVQLSLGRRVAVKVLPLAAALDSRHLQRFRNEAQAAAQLHHTNIVPVYAVGCERSVHFYAMQLIEGHSLADVVRLLRANAAGGDAGATADATVLERSVAVPVAADVTLAEGGETTGRGLLSGSGGSSAASFFARRTGADRSRFGGGSAAVAGPAAATAADAADNLSSLRVTKRLAYFQSVARLGAQAADALDYAHGLGIVHRDVKPANLLLDGRGTLWVTDFGLAQMYVDGGLTQPGDLLGTLRYMSPEQASGKAVVLDQRTDVYSLGVTLYELLTLEPAVPGQSREELLNHLGSADPRPPRSVDRTIPPELDTIIMKATAKDASERYPSAGALADDLRRFLRDEPILARPPSTWDRALKWTRRHKSLALSAIAMLVLATAALLVTTILVAREQSKTEAAYEREQLRANEANAQRLRADHSAAEAREAVDYFTRVAAEELPRDAQVRPVRRKMLEKALLYYQGFLDARYEDPSVPAELVAARENVATLLTELTAVDEASRLNFAVELLASQPVRDELLLSAAQVGAVDGILMSTPRGPVREEDAPGLTVEQRQARMTRLAQETQAALDEILLPVQADRLREISRQARGVLAFSDPDVVDALQLTAAQEAEILQLQREYSGPRRRPGGPGEMGGGPGGPEGGPGHGGPGGGRGGDSGPGDHGSAGPDKHREASPGGPPNEREPWERSGGTRRGGGPRGEPGMPKDRRGPGGPKDGDRTADREAGVKKVLERLTPDQAATWAALCGPRFTGELWAGGFEGRGPKRH